MEEDLWLRSGTASRWSCSDSVCGAKSLCPAREDDEEKEEDEDKDEAEDKAEEDDDADEVDRSFLSRPSTALLATILQGREAPDSLPSLTTTLTSVLL